MLNTGLMLGRAVDVPNTFGFVPDAAPPLEDARIYYEGDAPTCVIAPTGSGKGRDFLIPNLLTYPGPIIALDPKGELSAVCARRGGRWDRRSMSLTRSA